MLHPAALFTSDQSRAADAAAIAGGTPSATLMENAAKAVTSAVCEHYKPCPVLVVCGPGNNGGDGKIVARLLEQKGWPAQAVTIEEFSPNLLNDCKLVVDALFGTGLSREIKGKAKEVIAAINDSQLPVVAIDIPSGIDADSGQIMGIAIRARHTVTFVRPKLGHVLLPGKAHTGELFVYDIGISGDGITPDHFLNAPALWKHTFPFPAASAHKYTRGHAIIVGGPMATTGAARLAARGALRSGAGLVSVACAPDALPIYAATLTAIMTKPIAAPAELDQLLSDERITATLIGPGCGVNEHTKAQTLQLLSHKKACVLDADAITVFQSDSKKLFNAIAAPTVLTPHEGEFARLFAVNAPKPECARAAARQSGAVIVIKGNDTVIAAPDGRVAINANAPVWLATAGSGDVLAGIICGLLAQRMPAFEAACAGVWLHSEAANHIGPGLIAEDISEALPKALKGLYQD